MLGILDAYRGFSEDMKLLYRLGRRAGILTRLSDLSDPHKLARSQTLATQLGATRETIKGLLVQFMAGFI